MNSNSRTRGLKPHWKPGESGNPAGRPKKEFTLTTITKEFLQAPVKTREEMAQFVRDEFGIKEPTWAQCVVGVWLLKVCEDKNPAFLLELLQRTDGKIPVAVDIKEDITHTIVYEATITDTGQVNSETAELPSETTGIHNGQGEVHAN